MKDYFGYQEKVVIVTGASSGMGKATAEILVDLGAKVYALDWNACDVKGIEKFVQVDLSKKDSINQAMKELPKHVDSFFLHPARRQTAGVGQRAAHAAGGFAGGHRGPALGRCLEH